MEILQEGRPFPGSVGCSAVTIGVFDGVHLGHQALIGEACRLGSELSCPTLVVTFDRHPASVVRPDSAPLLLTDLTQKLERLADTGVDYAYVLHFDEERSLEDPADFVVEVLVNALHVRVVVVGQDFHFGHRRRGDVALLAEMGAAYGFKVIGMGLVEIPGLDGSVSSTAVRNALRSGDVALAARLLGRPHEVHGVVERGDARGRLLGFPTANVGVPGDIMLPADGVYAGRYERENGEVYVAAINVGRRPTFYENGYRLVEAHLVDFEGELYGEQARVRIETRLRGEVKFDSVEGLRHQLADDVRAARELLALGGQPESEPG